MFLLMLFMFCFFIGFVAMFAYLLKRMDGQARSLADEHAQLRVLLRAIESRLEKIAQLEKLNSLRLGQIDPDDLIHSGNEETDGAAGHDPLLHLSFEKPQKLEGQVDPGLSLEIEPGPWDMAAARNQR